MKKETMTPLAEQFEEYFTKLPWSNKSPDEKKKITRRFHRRAEAAIRADQDRVTRERIADAIKTNSIPRALVTVQGEAFFRKLDLLNHLSDNTEEK
jgi:hypothetical protein